MRVLWSHAKVFMRWNRHRRGLFASHTQAVRSMIERNGKPQTLPLSEETFRIDKRKVETGRVRVSVRTAERQQPVCVDLLHEEAVVDRVPIECFADAEPAIRQEGDVLVVPVFEEVLVKRIFVREELRISRRRRVEELDDAVTLRRQEAVIERTSAGESPKTHRRTKS